MLRAAHDRTGWMKWRMIAVLIVGLCLSVLVGASSAQAQGGVGVKIQPSLVEERVEPGEAYPKVLRVTNVSDKAQEFYMVARDVTRVEDGTGKPFFDESYVERTGFELSSWLILPKDPIKVDPGEQVAIPYTINVPEDATPGGHFGGVFVSTAPPDSDDLGAVVGYEVGALMNLRVQGDVIEEAQIREFSAGGLIFSEVNVPLKTIVRNLGNVLVRPIGFIKVTNGVGKEVGTVILNESQGGVYPDKERTFDGAWTDDEFRIGRYHALVSLTYGEDGKKTLTESISFWIMPLNVILPVLGGLLFVILLIYIGVRMHIRSQLKELERTAGASSRGNKELARQLGARSPLSRLAFIAIVLLSFTIVFLLILFVFLA